MLSEGTRVANAMWETVASRDKWMFYTTVTTPPTDTHHLHPPTTPATHPRPTAAHPAAAASLRVRLGVILLVECEM